MLGSGGSGVDMINVYTREAVKYIKHSKKHQVLEIRKIVQPLRIHSTLSKDPSSVPSTHIGRLTNTLTPPPGEVPWL